MSRLLSAGLLALMLTIAPGGNVAAVGPYAPSADTYTDRNNPDTNNGSEQNLLLSASRVSGCVETTYLWFRFDIPSTGTTIDSASLSLTFLSSGSGPVDLELRSSADTAWDETGLTWNNQPGLEAGVLGTATGVMPGSIATFGSPALAAYLNARQGQPVSLVVLADCDGSWSTESVALDLPAREKPGGSGASLTLLDPNAITLRSLTARSVGPAVLPGFFVGAAAGSAVVLIGLGASVVARRRTGGRRDARS